MTDDLVARLRNVALVKPLEPLCAEAADEITRLRADLAFWQKESEEQNASRCELLAKIGELRADLAAARALLRELLPKAKSASFDLLARIDAALGGDGDA